MLYRIIKNVWKVGLIAILFSYSLQTLAGGKGGQKHSNKHSQKHSHKHSQKLNIHAQIEELRLQIEALALGTASETVAIDCDAGDSLNDALSTPARELTIELKGICTEDILITRGSVTINGIGFGPTISGSVIISHETNQGPAGNSGSVTLNNLTLTSSSGEGLLVLSGHIVLATDLNVNTAALNGIYVAQGSHLICTNCNSSNNSESGLLGSSSSGIELRGTSQFSGNASYGIILITSSSLIASERDLINSYDITANDNGLSGILVIGGSSIHMLNDSGLSTLTANGNGASGTFGPGIFIATGGTGHIFADVFVSANNGVGVGAWAGALYVLGKLTATDHNSFGGFAGAGVAENGTLRLGGEVDLSNNLIGIWSRSGYTSISEGSLDNLIADISLIGADTVHFVSSALQLNSTAAKIQCNGNERLVGAFACDP